MDLQRVVTEVKMMSANISVVIPVKKEEAKIMQCLEAVFSQSLKPYEVLVVDGTFD